MPAAANATPVKPNIAAIIDNTKKAIIHPNIYPPMYIFLVSGILNIGRALNQAIK